MGTDKQKTAVEWLIGEISKDRVGQAIIKTFLKEFEQALKIEKEQIVEAHLDGQSIDEKQRYGVSDAKQYYNETYKK